MGPQSALGSRGASRAAAGTQHWALGVLAQTPLAFQSLLCGVPGGEKVCPAWCQLGLLGRQEGASRKTRCCQRAKGKSFLLVLLGRWRDSLTQLAKQSPVPIPRPLGLLWRIPASFFRASGDHRPAPLCRAAVAGINQQPSHPRALQLVKKPAPPGPPQYPGLAFRRLAGGSPLPAAGRRGERGAPCRARRQRGVYFSPPRVEDGGAGRCLGMGTSPGVGEGAPGWGGGTRGARRVPVMSGAVLSTPSQAGVGWGCHLHAARWWDAGLRLGTPKAGPKSAGLQKSSACSSQHAAGKRV